MPAETMTNESLLRRRESAVPRGPFNVAPLFAVRAEGARLWDVEGKEYIDFCGGIGCVNVGHNHPRVVDAVRRQADHFLHTCWHVAMYEPYVRLAERLNALVPIPGDNMTVYFNSGAEACENAVKIARTFTGRTAVVSFERGFHGRTLMGMSLTGKVLPYTEGFGPFAPEVYHLPWRPFFGQPKDRANDDVEAEARAALADLFTYQMEARNVACIMLEPVLGEGGFYPVHPIALSVLREVTKEHGILLVADEVQTGFGRCGSLFASERFGLAPDMILMAKSLAAGMPLSAVTAPAEIMNSPKVGGIGGTYGGNPISCAAAHAVLDIMAEEKLPERARDIGAKVMAAFERLAATQPHVQNPRGLGAMCAIDIVDPATGLGSKERAGKVLAAARENGLLAMTASGNVLRTLMPLTISDADLETGLATLSDAIAATV
jgi:4-aminobutyrate aminotransferase / (S)-3-amino-2-methylpropionate transaminase / 5-aminovalerate transaminase